MNYRETTLSLVKSRHIKIISFEVAPTNCQSD